MSNIIHQKNVSTTNSSNGRLLATLQNGEGVTYTYDTIGYGLGNLPGIEKITAGRNSMFAVYKSGLTKIYNGNALHMSSNVVKKGMYASVVGGFALDIHYGLKQISYDEIKSRLLGR